MRKYQAENEQDNLDELSRKLAVDLRVHVRSLQLHACLSPGWLKMVESLQHIAQIVQMEHRMPRDGDSTLWENDELTVRFLLEEGKLNLCLRLMANYYQTLQERGPMAGWLGSAAANLRLSGPGELEDKLLHFEQSLGQVLRCAYEHVESVQTTDLGVFFDHATLVLQMAASQPPTTFDRTQPALVLRYLASVIERIEQLTEDKIMVPVQIMGLVPLVAAHVDIYHDLLAASDDLTAGATFLACAIDTEAFETSPDAFLEGQAREHLRLFPAKFLRDMTSAPAMRKKLRPLLDLVQRL